MNTENNDLASVGISVSPCEDADRIGYEERQINRIVIRIAQYFLFKDYRVVFGHDWRENGVMRAVLDCAEIAEGTSVHPSGQTRPRRRMLNLVPTVGLPISEIASDALLDAPDVLEVVSIQDCVENPVRSTLLEEKFVEFWALRRRLTELLSPGCRICLGGKTTGYQGYYAGIAEEAYFALKMRKPLYLIGGFGGATAAVCAALVGDPALDEFSGAAALTPAPHLRGQNRQSPQMPMDGLAEPLLEFGLDRLSSDNGLDEADNKKLFEMTDVEAALSLISKGMGRAPSLTKEGA